MGRGQQLVLCCVLCGVSLGANLVCDTDPSGRLSPTSSFDYLPRKSVQWPIPADGYVERSDGGRLCLDNDMKVTTSIHSSAPTDASAILCQAYGVLNYQLSRSLGRQADCTKEKKNSAVVTNNLIKSIDVKITGAEGSAADLTKDVDESYKLNVTATSVEITAPSVFGARHAFMTLTNMLEVRNFEPVAQNFYGDRIRGGSDWHYILPYDPFVINDKPRLPHRGLMLDTARHYQEKRDLMKVIDGMSRTKMNVFHWHATDDQSFPLVLDKSKATIHGPDCDMADPLKICSGAYVGYMTYHQTEVEEFIEYARLRGVRVYIEIDQPSHARSWANRQTDLRDCDSIDEQEEGYCVQPICGPLNLKGKYKEIRALADSILEDWLALTPPGEIVHIGMDEIGTKCWGEATTDELTHKWLEDSVKKIQEIAKTEGKDRDILVWQDGLKYHDPNMKPPQIAQNVMAQVWDNATKAADYLKEGRDIIWSFYENMYLDCGRGNSAIPTYDSWCGRYKTWWHVYRETPDLTIKYEKNAPGVGHIRGGEVALWAEQADASNLHSLLWPRLAAWGGASWEARAQPLADPDNSDEAVPILAAQHQLSNFNTILLQDLKIRPTSMFVEWCVFEDEKLCDKFTDSYYDAPKRSGAITTASAVSLLAVSTVLMMA